MSGSVVFQQMLVIFILISVGYYWSKKGKLSEATSKQLSGVVTEFCNPAIMIVSALEAESATHASILMTAVIVVISYILLIVLGLVIPGMLRVEKKEQKFYNMMMVYGNTGFIGIPVVSAVLGNEAVIYVTVFNLVFNILVYTHGIRVLSSGEERTEMSKPAWLQIINIGTISSILAIIIYWWKIPVPVILADSCSYMGRCVTFLSMLILGVSLANMKLSEVFTEKKLYALSFLRLLVVPILFVLIVRRFVTDPLILGTVALVMAMPAGNMPLMLSKQMGLESRTLSKGIILTTLISMITIPIVALFV
ncbi:MAG: AEC family transporter [Lachnospiraceae bacterium]|nr:AEC family transporter [Lachnospiraceae bacterium]